MKLRFKHQKFQAEAAAAVCDVFAGQPYSVPGYMVDMGRENGPQRQIALDFTGWRNEPIAPGLSDKIILENINKIQRKYLIKQSEHLEGQYNLTIEMETGVGKTYTYIKTMYELNKRYGWTKFIVVVPSVAIREGVFKSFEITRDHFAEEYGKKIRFFIYNSAQLTEIDRFAGDSAINVMIINSQAFNARGKDARRITMRLDEFRSRRPIDILAKTNPILIIDEPQSVEGSATKEGLKQFCPLFTLRYSATHKKDSIYNMIYRLDAIDAYKNKLVKRISVKGISVSGSTGTEGYLCFESIRLYTDKPPTANLEFDVQGKSGPRPRMRVVNEGYNLYSNSGNLDEYRNGYTVTRIDGRDQSISFVNGMKLYVGEVAGKVSEAQLRRVQIRETIASHIDMERQLFYKGIKVLSLFFIDEVAKYKQYDSAGNQKNGVYADMFEEEYANVVENLQTRLGEDDYITYLKSTNAKEAHAGYFSIDKKSRRVVDSKLTDKKEKTSDDSDAYELIMKNKERLLDRSEPVRFIFSHSALREGWDNPNVFQICTLKQSGAEVRKRQEVGRGLRLAVNQEGERMDASLLGADVHNVNVLTVIASESYDSFAKGLQTELAEAVADRPVYVNDDLFVGKAVRDADGNERTIDNTAARAIFEGLIHSDYVKGGLLTDKYYEDKKNGKLEFAEEVKGCEESVASIIDLIYDPKACMPDNALNNDVTLTLDDEKLKRREFRELWSRINSKSAYVVDFDTDELVKKSIAALNDGLRVAKVYVTVESGTIKEIGSKAELEAGKTFVRQSSGREAAQIEASSSVKYDLIGKIVDETGLTRAAAASILTGIQETVFSQFKNNPEEFIIKASDIINEQKATVIIEHITYKKLESHYDTTIFTEPTLKGRNGVNAMEAQKHLYDYILYDSTNERKFAEKLDTCDNVAVYVKLPGGFFISTPVGKYNPDWAIAFEEGSVKHVYFVAETKGSMSTMELRKVELAKIQCAREHFRAISTDSVKYDVINSYEKLMDMVME